MPILFRTILVIGALIAVTGAIQPDLFGRAMTVVGLGSDPAPAPRRAAPPETVTVMEARLSAFRERLTATGAVRSWDAVDIATENPGRVIEVLFEDGNEVAEGDVLVRLDARMERAALARAEARVVETASAAERAQTLRARGAGTEAALDAAVAAAAVARAERDQAAVELSRMTVRAPFSGVLSSRRVSPGAYVQPGDALTRLDSLGRVKADLFVPSRALAVLDRGQTILATTVAREGQSFEGRIIDLDTRLDPQTRQVIVRADFPDPERVLFPGLELVAEIVLGESQAIVLPESALVSVGPSAFVFIADGDNTVTRKGVTVGSRRNGLVVIESGLEAGERVVVEGAEKLSDGNSINPLTPEQSPIRELLQRQLP